jgi:5-methylcytosine-specific restriction endonuclease McrA
MALYLINTDREARDTPTYDFWFQHRCAFAGDHEGHREEHARIFRKLQPTDTLFMYHSRVGYVGVGTVLEEWNQQVYEGSDRLLYIREAYEYRIGVQWVRDWRGSPRQGEDGLPVPRGGHWQEIDAIRFPMARLYASTEPIQSSEDQGRHLEDAIARSRASTDADRRRRIRAAPAMPGVTTVLTTIFQRNPDVIVEVLKRASGICECCGNPAPFARRSDGTPYLEVHHIVMLSAGGQDTETNTQALCPNCHRKAHFG